MLFSFQLLYLCPTAILPQSLPSFRAQSGPFLLKPSLLTHGPQELYMHFTSYLFEYLR